MIFKSVLEYTNATAVICRLLIWKKLTYCRAAANEFCIFFSIPGPTFRPTGTRSSLWGSTWLRATFIGASRRPLRQLSPGVGIHCKLAAWVTNSVADLRLLILIWIPCFIFIRIRQGWEFALLLFLLFALLLFTLSLFALLLFALLLFALLILSLF